ncbi:MAG: tyrosine-type recombinase/integrase [Methanoregula sp.]
MSVFAYLEDRDSASRATTLAGIKHFLDSVYGTSRVNTRQTTAEEMARYEHLGSLYVKDTKRDRLQDIKNWKKTSTKSPASMRGYLVAVRGFFKKNKIVLSDEDKEEISRLFKGGEEAPVDAPDHAQIRRFLEFAPPHIKAICLLMSATGMRIGGTCKFKETQIDWDRRMITLLAKDEKGDKGRVVFFTEEAEQAVREYLKIRRKIIAKNNRTVLNFTNTDKGKERHKEGGNLCREDGRLFPFDEATITRAWNKTLKKSGQLRRNHLDRVIFHPHTLRSFFITYLKNDGCPSEVVEVLVGHKLYLNYTRFTPLMLQEHYEKHSNVLVIGSEEKVRKTIDGITAKITELEGKNAAKDETIAALQYKLSKIEEQNEVTEKLRQAKDDPDVLIEYANFLKARKEKTA